jgi:hypothetical protein
MLKGDHILPSLVLLQGPGNNNSVHYSLDKGCLQLRITAQHIKGEPTLYDWRVIGPDPDLELVGGVVVGNSPKKVSKKIAEAFRRSLTNEH